MLTNTTEIGTATLPRRRLTIPAPTDVSPSAPRRPPRFPALAQFASAARRVPRAPIPVAFALAVLAVLATVAPEPAAAQTTFISNTGQTSNHYSQEVRATAFTTGTVTYTLSSVGIFIPSSLVVGTPAVKIYGDSGGTPGTLLATMTNPGTFADNAVHTFTAPANTTLSASTTYWVVTSNSAALGGTGFRVGVVPFTTLDSGAAAGWSIGAARLKNYIAAPSWNHSTRRIRFEIRGTNPPTVATAIPDQSATAGTAFSYVFPANTFSDADTSDTLTYTATKADDTALPTWLSFAAGTRTFSGTPQAADAGTVAVKVTASDGNGGSVSDAFDITVIISVPSNWTLKPTALAAGAKFRLLFLSSTTSAVSSTDIADYNTFIQTRAAAGHTDIRAYSAGFRVVGCTAAVDARDNTKTTYTTTDKGVPIYWLNGAKAADQYEDFYDGSWDDEANDKNESGTNGPDTSQAGNWPLTGCSHDGTEQWPLGASQVSVGRPNSSGSGHGPLFANAQITSGVSSLLYGLSGVFQVAAAVVVPNNPPAFSADTAARSVAENTAAGQNVGAALTATDADSDTLTYTLEGTDAASFDIVSGSGQIRTRTGVTYNHEAKSTHTVVVKADDGNGGTDTVTVTITVTDVDEPPGQPAAPTVSATAGSTTSLDVTWTAPTNTGPAIASYDLQYRAGTSGNFTNGPQNVTGTSAAIGSLAADTSYEVQVRATNAEGDGDWSVAGTGRTTATSAPGAPTGLTATASGTTAINLSWSAPGSTGGSAITGYKIEVSSNGGSSWTNLVANTSNTTTTYAHTGLTAGTTRHYRVSAINANGTGDPSNVANATTGATAPGAPTGLTATASGTTAINLSWSAPASTGGSAITGYKIEVSPNHLRWTDQVANTNSTATPPTRTPGSRVSAINANGAGTASNVANATTGATAPGAPTGLTATASGTTAINLSWSAPASTGGSAITGYKIEVSSNGGSSWTNLVANTSNTTTTYAHTGLTAGATRHYRVSAINANGTGDPSNVANATTDATAPGAPTGLTATASGTTAINLSWSAPAQHRRLRHHRYKIEVSPGRQHRAHRAGPPAPPATTASPPSTPTAPATASNVANATTPSPASRPRPAGPPRSTSPAPGEHRRLRHRLQDRGLTPLDQPRRQHEQYHHHLRAHRARRRHHAPLPRLRHQHQRHRHRLQRRQRHHGRHRSRRSDRPHGHGQRDHRDQPLLDPGQHRRLRHHRLQDRGLLQRRLQLDRPANTSSTATTYAHTGLTAGTTRHYRVSAINANGTGVPSNVANATTGATAPGAPTGLTATASGTTAINLSWSAPGSTGGSAITGYKIEVSSNGGSSWTNLVANTSNTTTTYAHTGLTAGATRHYRVSAINTNGTGTASNVANATTGQTTVTFGASSYTAAEGGATATVAVRLSAAASATVTIPLTKTHRGGATAADYSGVPSNVTFTAGQTRRTFTVTATDDADKDGGESVQLGFGTLPGGYAPGARRTATVTLVDDDANLIVNFGTERHTTVKVRESDTVWHRFIFSLSTSRYGPPNGNPQQPVTIPLVVTHRGGATPADYEVRGRRTLTSVTFGVGESVTSFSMRAIPDGRRETGEGLRLDFGPLPAGVRAGTWGPYETIEFVDQELPGYTVLFGAEAYTATEGGAPARVSIHLSEPVEIEPLVVRLVVTHVGATAADYTGIPKSVRFEVGEQTQTITVKATDDTDDDDGESVTLSFVNDPNGRVRVRTGPASATVALADNDGLRRVTVSFGAVTYTATEGGADATVRVELDAAPGRSVTVPLTKAHLGNATAADYSGIPMNVTFAANQTSRTFAVMATAGDGSDGGESVSIGFGTLPEGVFAGSPAATTVTLADGGEQRLVVNFGSSRGHTVQVREGARRLRLNVLLDSSPRRPLTIPLVVTHVGGATEADYAAIPESVTFAAGQTSAHYYVRALPDEEDETGEGLQLDFGPLPPGVRKGTWGPYETIDFLDPAPAANLSVSGTVVTVGFPGALDGGSTPSPRDFVVSVEAPGGEKAMAPVAAVAVEGSDVFLQLARPVAPDDTVTLSYLADAMHPIRDEAGSPAAPLTDAPVRNQTPASGLGPEAGLRVQAGCAAEKDRVPKRRTVMATCGLAGGTQMANPAPLAALLEAAQVGAGTGRLDLSSRHLTDITALAGLTGLRELDLRDNAIEDLWPLAGLRGLEALYLSGNQISDLRPLAGLRGLKVLDLAGNRIEDLWPLSGLTELRELDLADNAVADLGPLAGLAGLEALDLAGNRISDVWGPGYLTRLERLNLADNAIEDLRPLARLTRLEVLLLDRNRITDVLALSPMAELANLGLAGNPIANLWPLEGLGQLHRLDLSGNAAADPSALGRVENLRWLWLDPAPAAELEAAPGRSEGRGAAPLWTEPGARRSGPAHRALVEPDSGPRIIVVEQRGRNIPQSTPQ